MSWTAAFEIACSALNGASRPLMSVCAEMARTYTASADRFTTPQVTTAIQPLPASVRSAISAPTFLLPVGCTAEPRHCSQLPTNLLQIDWGYVSDPPTEAT
jgi:hypothetical protein